MSAWVTESCTLPTVEQPLREAEFAEVFATAVEHVERPTPERLVLELKPTAEVAARVADLAVRETGCCAFFTFTQIATAGALRLEISVVPGHVDVLDALADQSSGSSRG